MNVSLVMDPVKAVLAHKRWIVLLVSKVQVFTVFMSD